ncbi:MAG TPA: hypothetical protein VGE97_03855 [Nitrososphaera sp.]|jgi:hypothetical protein
MINRIVSVSVLLCVVVVLIWGVLSPDNPLFFFISSNKWLSISRLFLAGAVVFVTYTGVIRSHDLKRLACRCGLGLMALGTFLFLLTQLQPYLFDYFKPLDLLLLVEAGVILTSASLAPASTPVPQISQLRLPLKTAKALK